MRKPGSAAKGYETHDSQACAPAGEGCLSKARFRPPSRPRSGIKKGKSGRVPGLAAGIRPNHDPPAQSAHCASPCRG